MDGNITNFNFPPILNQFFHGAYSQTSNVDANDPTAFIMSGWGIENAPTNGGLVLLTLPYQRTILDYCAQLCLCVQQNTSYYRYKNNGKWSDWFTI